MISEYPVSSELWEDYERELQIWMDNCWLLAYIHEMFGPPKALTSLMTVLKTYDASCNGLSLTKYLC